MVSNYINHSPHAIGNFVLASVLVNKAIITYEITLNLYYKTKASEKAIEN